MKKAVFIFLVFSMALTSCLLDSRQNPDRINDTHELQDYLRYDWNTWNNPDVLSHVLLPEGLAIKISFRSTTNSAYPHFLNESFISKGEITGIEKILPKAHSLDGSYTDLIIKWKGLTARIQTATYDEDIFILYSPQEIPGNPHLLLLEVAMLWDKPGYIEKNENLIQADIGQRSFGIGTTGKDSLIPLPVAAEYMTFTSANQIGFFTGRKRSLEYIKNYILKKETEYKESIQKYENMQEPFHVMQSALAWNTIYDPFNDRVITPVSRLWNENRGGYVLFNWDTYFNAAMFAVENKYFAFANAIAITNEITPEGFVPNYSAALSMGKSFDRSQPPVGSLICNMIYEKYPEKWFIKTVFDSLLRWNRWWEKERDNDGYLSWGSDPYTKRNFSNSKQAAQWESGLDNSPLFDSAAFNPQKNTLELASVDLLSLYIADCQNLAIMAKNLERFDEEEELKNRAKKYIEKLTTLWDEETGIYRDKNLITGEFSNRLSPTSFYPLLTAVPTMKQAKRMIDEHFMNPEEFYGEYMLPSISRNDSAFQDNSYWRGRIWGPVNFLVYLGLRNYDLPDARKILADKSLNLLMKEWKDEHRIYENYNAVTGEGNDVDNSDSFYSWGGLLALIPLIEYGYWDVEIDEK